MGRVNSINTIYRSVPPRSAGYTLTDDVWQTTSELGNVNGTTSSRSETSRPVSISTAEENVERFSARLTAKPAVIHLNDTRVQTFAGSGECCRIKCRRFPVVKARNAVPVPASAAKAKKTVSASLQDTQMTDKGRGTLAAMSNLYLVPPSDRGWEQNMHPTLMKRFHKLSTGSPANVITAKPSSRTSEQDRRFLTSKSALPSFKNQSKFSGSIHACDVGAEPAFHDNVTPNHSMDGQRPKLIDSKTTTVDIPPFTVTGQEIGDHHSLPEAVMAHPDDYFDLNEQWPTRLRSLPRRDLPWVHRFKVKKEMNILSKVMATKPSNTDSGSSI